jgi:hypothetical protein
MYLILDNKLTKIGNGLIDELKINYANFFVSYFFSIFE